MELKQLRHEKSATTTIGDFLVNGTKLCYGLEPFDRDLTSDMSLDEIKSIKVHDRTAIPRGRYRVTKYFSPKHQIELPLLVGVPGFEGVEIHVGNFSRDTDGCLLLGYAMGADSVLDSRNAINDFYSQFFTAWANGEEIWITYEDFQPAVAEASEGN